MGERRRVPRHAAGTAPTGADREPDADEFPPISDYAMIGNCRTGALVSRTGAVEWFCVPRFDGDAVFAAILDREQGGIFRVAPAGGGRVERHYRGHAPVLDTDFTTEGGVLRLTDLMPVSTEGAKLRHLFPEHELLRVAECRSGEVAVDVLCRPRPRFGAREARLDDRGALGVFCDLSGAVLVLASNRPDDLHVESGCIRGRIRLRAGERLHLSLTYGRESPLVLPLPGDEAVARIEGTLEWWDRWIARCRYDGPHEAMVLRSLVTLKLLTYAPSGAVIAALTASLPEDPGGNRNFDYRYCWLRDAAATLGALLDLGYDGEGTAFFNWLMHATALTRPELRLMYDVHGDADVKERELDHLGGYRGSRPVRVGNAAADQFQLDVYGEIVAAAERFVTAAGGMEKSEARHLVDYGDVVCRRWREPDEGIWEPRSGRRHNTFSKVMCWVALQRLLHLHERGHVEVDVERYRRECEAIRATVEEHGYDEELGSYVYHFDEQDVDASLLLLPHFGYLSATDPRFHRTYELIRERLADGPLLHRYAASRDDGMQGTEGAFGIASFWAVESLVEMGRAEEAAELFASLLDYSNDVGLYAEEIDPGTGEPLGNFPQAYTHLALVNAALALAGQHGREAVGDARDGTLGGPEEERT
ncbi:MAG: glycoside hydrolase family 15 protein [Candidatus Krumholzibacteriia bacterium]